VNETDWLTVVFVVLCILLAVVICVSRAPMGL
jgi:hypothetical protein